MTTIATRTALLALATAAMMSVNFGVANALELTPPDSDIRALEAPVDVTPNQLRAQHDHTGLAYQGRSVAVDPAETPDR